MVTSSGGKYEPQPITVAFGTGGLTLLSYVYGQNVPSSILIGSAHPAFGFRDSLSMQMSWPIRRVVGTP